MQGFEYELESILHLKGSLWMTSLASLWLLKPIATHFTGLRCFKASLVGTKLSRATKIFFVINNFYITYSFSIFESIKILLTYDLA